MLQAAKLLGFKSFDEVIASEGQQEVREEFRPPLLGLGADPQKPGKVRLVCALLSHMNIYVHVNVHA